MRLSASTRAFLVLRPTQEWERRDATDVDDTPYGVQCTNRQRLATPSARTYSNAGWVLALRLKISDHGCHVRGSPGLFSRMHEGLFPCHASSEHSCTEQHHHLCIASCLLERGRRSDRFPYLSLSNLSIQAPAIACPLRRGVADCHWGSKFAGNPTQ